MPWVPSACKSSGSTMSRWSVWGHQNHSLYFFFPFLAREESLSRGENRRIPLNFPVPCPCCLLPYSEGCPLLSTTAICPRVRVGAGCPWAAGQVTRWPHKGTKDCESTTDSEGTSQTRAFIGLLCLNSTICVNRGVSLWSPSKGLLLSESRNTSHSVVFRNKRLSCSWNSSL